MYGFPIRILSVALAALALTAPMQAVILFGGDNAANLTDPGGGIPFSSTGRFVNGSGAGEFGSLVYLGNKYVLTANHVGVSTHVTFDGSTLIPVDNTFVPVQVAAEVDLKIARLAADPGVPSVILDSRPIASTVQSSTIVGFGRGRDPATPVNSSSVTWGSSSTIAKRWGTNDVEVIQSITTGGPGGPYSYTALVTILGNSEGENEAALVYYDSGSPLFQTVSGSYFLTAIATAVENYDKSTFGADDTSSSSRGDANFFVPVSPYRDAILAVIPEPSSWGLVVALATFLATSAARLSRSGLSTSRRSQSSR
jgi:hypothetical protein